MKLLIDNNLSYKVALRLQDVFPNSLHVGKVGLSTASDILLWEFAREGGFTILTKDEDFNFLSMLRGPPPKVIWLRTGNSSVDQIEALLRENVSSILDFIQSEIRVLELYS